MTSGTWEPLTKQPASSPWEMEGWTNIRMLDAVVEVPALIKLEKKKNHRLTFRIADVNLGVGRTSPV